MNKNLLLLILVITTTYVLSGCAGREFVRTDIRNEMKKEVIVKTEPLSDISVDPATSQKQDNEGVTVEIVYLRKMNPSDYTCVKRTEDPLNPMLLFAFRMLNTTEEIKYYNPVFAFKGIKTLDLADKNPCSFFSTYGAVNYLVAKPGYKFALSCESSDTDQLSSISRQVTEPVTLYPDIPVHGILIVSQEQLDQAVINEKGVKTSIVKGWAAFFEKVASNRRPTSFRFDYKFTRSDWQHDVKYNKKTPYTYKVNVYQKTTYIPILGTIQGDYEEEVIEDSEQYSQPVLDRIGPITNDSEHKN